MFRKYYKHSFDNVEKQERRRKLLLQQQKTKRAEVQDEYRELEDFLKVAPPKNDQKRVKKKHRLKFHGIYRSDLSLQLSEWMRERPKNLDDYMMVACPRGSRCLVVARAESTKMYSKQGKCFLTFRSMLPGDGTARRTISMLDCIYVNDTRTIFVLDALVYANQDLLDCDTQFRFFWLRSKIEEEPGLGEINQDNTKRFRVLDRHDMSNVESVAEALQRFPLWDDNSPELDGFLFYHKEASYTCGSTPLVCWLFPFMVHDILGMSVSPQYEGPPDYVDPHQYMEKFDGDLLLKQRYKKSRPKQAVKDNVPDALKLGADAMNEADVEEESLMNEDEVEEESPAVALLEAEREMELEYSEGEEALDDTRATPI